MIRRIPLGPAATTETHLGLLADCEACAAYARAHPGTVAPAGYREVGR